MTFAVCIRCGHDKLGARARCRGCGFDPGDDREAQARSLMLCDHNLSREELEAASAQIKRGASVTFDQVALDTIVPDPNRNEDAARVQIAVSTLVAVMTALAVFVVGIFVALRRLRHRTASGPRRSSRAACEDGRTAVAAMRINRLGGARARMDAMTLVPSPGRPAIVTLLGAGASMPEMLSTKEVTELLVGWNGRREPHSLSPSALRHSFGSLQALQSDRRSTLFATLRAQVSKGLKAQDFANFEHLIHAVELLASTLPIPVESNLADRRRYLLSPFFQVAPGLEHWNISGSDYTEAADAACYEILDWFRERCDGASNPGHALPVGLKSLAASFDLRMFSLNYDDLPFESGLDMYTGFRDDGRFRPTYPWPTDGHCLCQLHGSVRFGRIDGEISAFSTRSEAAAARASRPSGGAAHDGHRLGSAPMITGLRKADKALERPFGTYMHVFRDELLRSNRWLIVGYSFTDLHINSAMKQALANWKQRGDDVRAVIVDYVAPERDATTGEVNTMAAIGYPTGDKIFALFDPVFREACREFFKPMMQHLDPTKLSLVGGSVGAHFGGVRSALGASIGDISAFLAS
jgi:hypothetical protein